MGLVHESILTEPGPLLLVGHLPNLGRLANQLTVGDANGTTVELGPSALVVLVERNDGWRVLSVMQPEFLP